MSTKIKIIDPHKCEKCGKLYGKSNYEYLGCEVWLACDCHPKDQIHFIDLARLHRKIGELPFIYDKELAK